MAGRAQRGDAEMAQKLWRVVRACVELGPGNPIQQIHDQGAGGNCNVVRPLWHQLDLPCPGRAQHPLAMLSILWRQWLKSHCKSQVPAHVQCVLICCLLMHVHASHCCCRHHA